MVANDFQGVWCSEGGQDVPDQVIVAALEAQGRRRDSQEEEEDESGEHGCTRETKNAKLIHE